MSLHIVVTITYVSMFYKMSLRASIFVMPGQQSCMTAGVQTATIEPGGSVVKWSVWCGTISHPATFWSVQKKIFFENIVCFYCIYVSTHR